jgi:7-keto-8-aminopelargonate synthetase-like enzyme
MEDRRIDATPTRVWSGPDIRVAAIVPELSRGGRLEEHDSVPFIEGWAAGVAWIKAQASRGCCIVLDRSTHRDVCREMDFDDWELLWCERVDADDVLAMLTELRSRSEKREILVVRRERNRMRLESAGLASLRALCAEHRAALLVVIHQP